MKIIVGYDGSNAGKEALTLGLKHAAAFNAKLYIIRSMVGGSEEDVDKIEDGERDLVYAETLCKENNIPCEIHLLIRGFRPGEDIVQFANENDIDEIIIGVKRRSRVGKIIFGSNAQYVIMEAQCPVVTVK